MKITLLVNRDLAANLALNYLVKALGGHQLNFFLSDKVGHQTRMAEPLQHLHFAEQSLFNQLVFPLAARCHTHETRPQYLTFEAIAEKLGQPLLTLNDINQSTGLAQLRRYQPDLILSIRFGKILQAEAIAVPPLGVLNLHSGLLPEYRGVMATFWAMLRGASHYGTSLHYIDSAAIDAGPLVALNQQPLDLTRSYLDNVLSLYPHGCRQMVAAVEQLQRGEALTHLPYQGDAAYFSFPDEANLLEFSAKRLRLFDPSHLLSLAWQFLSTESPTI